MQVFTVVLRLLYNFLLLPFSICKPWQLCCDWLKTENVSGRQKCDLLRRVNLKLCWCTWCLFSFLHPVSTGKDKVSTGCDTPQPGIARYLKDVSFGYSDFASRNPQMDISTFKVQDYSWEEHGFSLINRLYPDMGQMLDDKFSCTFNLTYNT